MVDSNQIYFLPFFCAEDVFHLRSILFNWLSTKNTCLFIYLYNKRCCKTLHFNIQNEARISPSSTRICQPVDLEQSWGRGAGAAKNKSWRFLKGIQNQPGTKSSILVVSQLFFEHFHNWFLGGNHPIWQSDCSNGLVQPPPSQMVSFAWILHLSRNTNSSSFFHHEKSLRTLQIFQCECWWRMKHHNMLVVVPRD